MEGFGCSILFILCLNVLYANIWAATNEEQVEWTHELIELKKTMTILNNKIADLDHRMAELNFLEYAFKVNMVDTHLTTIKQSVSNIDARMTRMDTQAEIIKDMLKSISEASGAPCRAMETEGSPASQRAGGEESQCKSLNVAIADYGYKVSKSQQELKDTGHRNEQALVTLLETVRGSFNKIFQKVDIIPNTETQLSRMSSSISAMASHFPQALANLTSVSQRLTVVQSEVAKVSQTLSEGGGGHSSNDNSVSASITHAMELGTKVKMDLEKLVQLEPDILLARKLADNLLTGPELRRPIAMETLKNLTLILEKLETTTGPLLVYVPYNFGGIYELLETALDSMDTKHTSVCNFRDVFKMELKAINDRIGERGTAGCASGGDVTNNLAANEEDGGELSPTSKQNEVFENLSYVRSAVMLLKTDLEDIFRQCPDGSLSMADPSDRIGR